MARQKITPFPPWLSLKPNGRENRYIRLGNSILLHPAVRELNPLAFKVYTYMLLESAGQAEYEFPYSKFKGFASKDGFQRAIKELTEVGLIEVAAKNANLRKPNKYRFSEAWKDDKRA